MDEADLESELDRLTAPDEIYDVAADLKQTFEAIRARTAAWVSAHAAEDLFGARPVCGGQGGMKVCVDSNGKPIVDKWSDYAGRTAAWASAHAPPDLDGKIEEAMLYLCMDARTYADADEEDEEDDDDEQTLLLASSKADEQTLLLASSKADEHTPLLASSKKKETNWMGLRQRAEAVAPMPRPPEAVAMPPVPSPGSIAAESWVNYVEKNDTMALELHKCPIGVWKRKINVHKKNSKNLKIIFEAIYKEFPVFLYSPNIYAEIWKIDKDVWNEIVKTRRFSITKAYKEFLKQIRAENKSTITGLLEKLYRDPKKRHLFGCTPSLHSFADRKKQVYKKLQGKTIEEMMKGVADRIATLRREKNDLLIVLKDYDARFKERNGRGIRDDGYSPVSAQYYHYKKLRKEIKEMEETAEIGVQTDE